MTSNQIAYATEQETERHNRRTEEIADEQNRIAEMKANNEREHNQAIEAIQSRYNDTYLRYSEAQGQEKLDLQRELQEIEREKVDIDNFYKTEMIALNASDVQTRQEAQQSLQKYQENLIAIGYSEAEAKKQANFIRDKEVEYQKHYQEEQIRIQDYNALNQGIKVSNDYLTNMTKVRNDYFLGVKELKLRQESLDLTNAKTASDIRKQDFELQRGKALLPGEMFKSLLPFNLRFNMN